MTDELVDADLAEALVQQLDADRDLEEAIERYRKSILGALRASGMRVPREIVNTKMVPVDSVLGVCSDDADTDR